MTGHNHDHALTPTWQAGQIAGLRASLGGLEGESMIAAADRHFGAQLGAITSFGADAALLLDMIARVRPDMPVFTADMGEGYIFPETRAYRDQLIDRLRLSNVQIVRLDPAALDALPAGQCCGALKGAALDAAMDRHGIKAFLSGLKIAQSSGRDTVDAVRFSRGRININPLAAFDDARMDSEYIARDLPPHPLNDRDDGINYPSIGCIPCTSPGPERARPFCGLHPEDSDRPAPGKTPKGPDPK